MLKKKYYDGFTVHDILSKHLDDGHKILELLTAFADADGVDAVEVIRCKDCKHYYEKEWVVGGGSYTTCWYQTIANAQPNDFCSRAERKEE